MRDQVLEVTYLHFIVEAEHYLMNIDCIESVFFLPELECSKKGHNAIVGELNYQGAYCDIYDMANLFFSEKNLKQSLDTPIILCEFHDKFIGFMVSDVLDTALIALEDLSQQDKASSGPYIKLVYKEDFSAKVIDYKLLTEYFKLESKYGN
jgi:chemotaxis signal transduction protein